MANLKTVAIEPPWAGLFTGATPGKCPPGTAPFVNNFMTHLPGRLKARNGIQESPYATVNANVTSSEKAIIGQVWTFNDRLLVSFHRIPAAETEGYLPPWKTPYWKATESKLAAKSAKKLAYINLTAGTMEETTIEDEHLAPGSNGARLGKYVFGYAYSDATISEINGGYQAETQLLRWAGTKTKPTAYTNAPKGSQAVKAYLDRLWVLGGTDPTSGVEYPLGKGNVGLIAEGVYMIAITDPENVPLLKVGNELTWTKEAGGTKTDKIKAVNPVALEGGKISYQMLMEGEYLTEETNRTFTVKVPSIGIESNALFFTDGGGPTSDELGFWQDDVSGLVNRIVVGEEDGDDYGVMLAVVNQSLVIFKRHSIWALYGYSPSTYQVRNITKERGCIDPASVCEVDGGVYFASQRGIEFFDGTQFRKLSGPIQDVYDRRSQHLVGEKNSGAHPKAEFGRLTLANIGNDYLMLIFGAQASLTGAEQSVNLVLICHAPTGTWSKFTCSVLGGEGAGMFVDSTIAIPWIWDGLYITPIYGIYSDITNTNYDFLHGTGRHVPAKFISDRIELAAPAGYVVQMHRFLFDYAYSGETTDKGWYVKLVNGDSSSVMDEQQVPCHPLRPHYLDNVGSGTYLHGRRFEFDTFNEATDVQMVVERREESAPSFTPSEMEVYDTVLEYQITRQRRSL